MAPVIGRRARRPPSGSDAGSHLATRSSRRETGRDGGKNGGQGWRWPLCPSLAPPGDRPILPNNQPGMRARSQVLVRRHPDVRRPGCGGWIRHVRRLGGLHPSAPRKPSVEPRCGVPTQVREMPEMSGKWRLLPWRARRLFFSIRGRKRRWIDCLGLLLERVDIWDSHGLENLIQTPFRGGGLNEWGSLDRAGSPVGAN